MLFDVNKGDKIYHKLLGDIAIVRVEANSIFADTGQHGILEFPFYDFGKVLFFEKSHVKKSFDTENEYADFCIQNKRAKEEQKIADALEFKKRQDIINKYNRESIEGVRQNKEKSDSKKTKVIDNKKNDPKQSVKRDHVQEVKANPAQEINSVVHGLIDRAKEDIGGLSDLKRINEILKNHINGIFNYADPLEQQLYLLRYFYAYYYEYKKIMACIDHHLQKINVVSIGCGSCIDGLALKHVVKGPSGYLGIDCVEWAYKLPLSDNCEIHNIRITENTRGYLNDATILFFPKSLSDISYSEMNGIKKWIQKSVLENNEICVAASFVYNSAYDDKNHTADQFRRYQEILSILKTKNYIKDEYRSFTVKEKEDSNKKIWHVDKEMPQPSSLLDFFNGGMEKACKKYSKNYVHCEVCKKTNGKYDNECTYSLPKLSAAGMYYEGAILRKG